MPFGAQCGDHGTRFALWAPAASWVKLELIGSDPQDLVMNPGGDGWFELVTSGNLAGVRYRFHIDGKLIVPDPASRFQPEGVHGPSEVIDPSAYEWRDAEWLGRPWTEAVIYEMHMGAFTPDGTFAAAEKKLDYLAELGVTAIEIMPISSFPGDRNWGYDGVLPFAPASPYGRPEDLKRFIDAAHAKSLMVFLDVVYNHFGPEGNHLPFYAPQFFTDRHRTPWGKAINFGADGSSEVRAYFMHNALYWLEEYHFDGLRFDAVHAIRDDSRPSVLQELAEAVDQRIVCDRHLHLVLENDNNASRYLERASAGKPRAYTAQWNDDFHHAVHVIVTGESHGFYADYSQDPTWHLARCLAEGFSYQGETSSYRAGTRRGEPSRDLPPTAFVSFLQNHDQVGNRALGERVVCLTDASTLRVAVAVLLLAPSPPLLFMGDEFGATTPFVFFCDFVGDLARKVADGRRAEFVRHTHSVPSRVQARIPDPNQSSTFQASKLDWRSLDNPTHRLWLEFYRELLAIRCREIVPRLPSIVPGKAGFQIFGERCFGVRWPLGERGQLSLAANFSNNQVRIPVNWLAGRVLYAEPEGAPVRTMAPCSAIWMLNE
jgi:malto-oligosyltrehalose trehalohydrolase